VSNTTYDHADSSRPFKRVKRETKRALWQLSLNANAPWFKFFPAVDKITGQRQPKGTNHGRTSTGHILKSGVDRRYDAGKPYQYTPEWVDKEMLGFGFWSRSTRGTYRFIAHDLEPKDDTGGKAQAPDRRQIRNARAHAITVYGAWRTMGRRYRRTCKIVAVGLFQSSEPGHYHIWVWFREPLTQAQHDLLLAKHQRTATRSKRGRIGLYLPAYQDKDTSAAQNGLGTMFRAPWSYKDQRQIQCMRLWVADEGLLHRLGEECVPPTPEEIGWVPTEKSRAKTHDSPRGFRPDDVEYLLAYAISKYLLQHPAGGKGNRNRSQARLIYEFLCRGVEPPTILQIGHDWLQHFKPSPSDKSGFVLELGQAQQEFTNSLNYSLDKQEIGELPRKPIRTEREHTLLAKDYKLVVNKRTSKSINHHLSIFPHHEERKSAVVLTGLDQAVVDALLVQSAICLDRGQTEITFTNQQILDLVRARGTKLACTIQNFSATYLSRFLTREERNGRQRPAKCRELLVRVRTGLPGGRSSYRPTPLLLGLLSHLGCETSSHSRQAQKGHPEARPEAQNLEAGPGAVPAVEAERAVSDLLQELPEDDPAPPVLPDPEPENPLMQLPE
jgi:hypothetical protein